jgi:hypothetical protein
MSTEYYDYVLSPDGEIIRDIQTYCADIADDGEPWTTEHADEIAAMLNQSKNPRALFSFMDERTGSSYVGYRTRDGREWFHILRQMRNTRGCGLLENLGRR